MPDTTRTVTTLPFAEVTILLLPDDDVAIATRDLLAGTVLAA